MLVILCTLLKVYLPACSSHIVATSNHTRVCLHSRELLSFPTLRVVCIFCLCVCVYPSELLLELFHTQGCLYVCTIMYMCVMCILSVYVFVCTLLLELFHAWVCVYICS